jgi:hypothetical protein
MPPPLPAGQWQFKNNCDTAAVSAGHLQDSSASTAAVVSPTFAHVFSSACAAVATSCLSSLSVLSTRLAVHWHMRHTDPLKTAQPINPFMRPVVIHARKLPAGRTNHMIDQPESLHVLYANTRKGMFPR